MSEIVIVAHFQAEAGCEQKLQEPLEALVEPTRAEEGCLAYRLHQCTDDHGAFVFYERWASAEAVERHGQTAHITRFREIREPLVAHADVRQFKQIA
jgi:quinol monooxygenase YgiN